MTRSAYSRRSLLATLPGIALIAAVGCGDDDDDESASPATSATTGTTPATVVATAAATTAVSAFPVTITHKFGKAEIKTQPKRVVSVGYSEQDTLLALGVAPVGIRYWYGDYPYATWPWAQDELGSAKPEVLTGAELDFEKIATLKPDLIIGLTSGMTVEEYTTLSKIAPTIAQSDKYVDYGVPWRDIVAITGQALGLDAKAKEVVASVDAQLAKVRTDHPEWQGKTAAVAFFFSEMPGAYSSQDGRSRLMTDMGFKIPPKFDELAANAFYFSVSNEQITQLDADLIIWLGGSAEVNQQIKDLPLRMSLTAAQKGQEIFADELLGGAFSFGTPLSMTYLLERMVPMIEAALRG